MSGAAGASVHHGGFILYWFIMSKVRGCFRLFLRLFLAVFLCLLLGVGFIWWYTHPTMEVTRGVVYTQRNGQNLTFDVLKPEHPNGIAVLAMVSGGWKSAPGKYANWMAAPFLREGHTVFTVSHLSQPLASVPEIVEDVNRAARYVRSHAKEYGIDPQRIGVVGGSSGGHLSLMLATRGGPGKADAPDPIDRADSSVQAVAVFFPVTDLINLGTSTENLHDGGPPKSFRNAFGPNATDLEVWKVRGREVSPIYHVTPSLPPIYIAHGDKDTLVPLDQSERFLKRAAEVGRPVELIVRPGKGHGWLTAYLDARDFAQWLTSHLPAKGN